MYKLLANCGETRLVNGAARRKALKDRQEARHRQSRVFAITLSSRSELYISLVRSLTVPANFASFLGSLSPAVAKLEFLEILDISWDGKDSINEIDIRRFFHAASHLKKIKFLVLKDLPVDPENLGRCLRSWKGLNRLAFYRDKENPNTSTQLPATIAINVIALEHLTELVLRGIPLDDDQYGILIHVAPQLKKLNIDIGPLDSATNLRTFLARATTLQVFGVLLLGDYENSVPPEAFLDAVSTTSLTSFTLIGTLEPNDSPNADLNVGEHLEIVVIDEHFAGINLQAEDLQLDYGDANVQGPADVVEPAIAPNQQAVDARFAFVLATLFETNTNLKAIELSHLYLPVSCLLPPWSYLSSY